METLSKILPEHGPAGLKQAVRLPIVQKRERIPAAAGKGEEAALALERSETGPETRPGSNEILFPYHREPE